MSAAVVTHWANLLDPEGREETLDWTELFCRLSERREYLGDKVHPGWSPARFEPCRRGAENVRALYAACLDYDAGGDPAAVLEFWRDAFCLVHTTRKHTPEAPRCRVVLPWSRPISPFEHDALWRRLDAHTAGRIDPATKDAPRFWFWPGAVHPEHFVALTSSGKLLDPDEWLRKPDPQAAPPALARPAEPRDPNALERRAVAYIARMPEAISGQGGHQATWHVALMLAKGFGLSEEQTFRILWADYNPRCQPAWTERELRHKAKQAAAARVPDGFKLEDDREWRPRRELPPCPPDDPDYVPEPPEWLHEGEPANAPEPTPAPPAETRQPGDDSAEIASEQQAEKASPWKRFGFLSMVDLMQLVVDEMRKSRPRAGLRTGSNDLDVAIGGFRPGNVTIFGAKRGFGKSSFGNMIADLALRSGARVALFAGEDAAMMYGKRLLAMRAKVNAMLLRDYKCRPEDWTDIMAAIAEAPPIPFFTRVDGKPVEWIAQAIRELRKDGFLDLVIVDYLQCLKSKRPTQDRRNEVTLVAKTLSDAIKTVGASGLLFSQLKRTERIEPEIEDLKESGDLEDMADHILLGWREEQKTGPVKRLVKIGKNKDGLDASEFTPVALNFQSWTASFQPEDVGDLPYTQEE